jgi:Zn-dependent peptidase ImmA (M78 family)
MRARQLIDNGLIRERIVDKYITPVPCNLPDAQIANGAEAIARNLHLSPETDLEQVVSSLGGRIDYESIDPWSDESGSIYIEEVGDFRIVLPSHTSLTRDRFTVAHELGHYFLHFLLPHSTKHTPVTPMRAKRFGSGLVEIEANIFAASFLMPAELFATKYAELGGHNLLLADYFNVSPSAAAVREKVLKLGQ